MAIDLSQVDLLASPLTNIFIAAIGDIVGKPSNIFVIARFQLIAPDDLHSAFLSGFRPED
jgi:hypothetical protein